MIKKLRASLTAKIFLITTCLLSVCCALTYLFIALAMPITYSQNYRADTFEKAEIMLEEVKKLTEEEAGSLFEAFAADTGTQITVYNAAGDWIFRSPEQTGSNGVFVTVTEGRGDSGLDITEDTVTGDEFMQTTVSGVQVEWSDGEREPAQGSFSLAGIGEGFSPFGYSISGVWYADFTFADDSSPYTVEITYQVGGINQALEALGQILPWVILAVLFVSLLGALIYSRYVTRPIVRISAISEKLAGLDFGFACSERRTDEIGILSNNLNELSRRLSAALEELQQANASLLDDIERERMLEKKRMDFFAAVSHELKTPITIIKGQAEGMLHSIGVYQDRDKYLARVLAVTQTLERTVQEILTISRMERTGFEISCELLDLGALMDKALETYAELAAQAGLTVHTDFADDMIAHGDAGLLQKVISNLISNAVFYSAPGEHIYIKALRKADRLCVTVENTGVRIPQESMPRLFEPFYRVEQSRNRRTGGSGLGLYLVKMILELHHAAYKMENTEAGVQFTFCLPAERQDSGG